jgi:CRP-like cAMP-binding protein
MPTITKSIECPDETLKPGSVIFEEGSTSNCFYIIKQGEVDVFKNYGKPNQIQLATIPAGRVIGEISCLDNGPRTATAVARSETRITKVAADTLKWQLKQCPQWFGAIVLDLVERLRATDNLIHAAKTDGGISGMSSMKATDSN